MDHKLKLVLVKRLLRKEGSEGFSLIELVVVVAVLAVLSAIAIPTFTCFPKKAKATAALAVMKEIQKECKVKTYLDEAETLTKTQKPWITQRSSDVPSSALQTKHKQIQ